MGSTFPNVPFWMGMSRCSTVATRTGARGLSAGPFWTPAAGVQPETASKMNARKAHSATAVLRHSAGKGPYFVPGGMHLVPAGLELTPELLPSRAHAITHSGAHTNNKHNNTGPNLDVPRPPHIDRRPPQLPHRSARDVHAGIDVAPELALVQLEVLRNERRIRIVEACKTELVLAQARRLDHAIQRLEF